MAHQEEMNFPRTRKEHAAAGKHRGGDDANQTAREARGFLRVARCDGKETVGRTVSELEILIGEWE